MTAPVHFILGESAASSLRVAFSDARIARILDNFTEGRCRFDGVDGVHEWLEARHRWWLDEAGAESPEAWLSAPERVAELEDALAQAREAILWLADGATERLHGCWLAAIIPEPVRLQVALPRKRWGRQFIGMFNAEELAQGEARDLPDSERAELADIWHAFVEPTPRRFFALVDGCDPGRLGYGLSQLRNRLPSRADGLTHWERALLRAITKYPGRSVGRAIAEVIGRDRGLDWVTDQTLLDHLFELTGQGLLEELGDGGGEMFSTHVRLTELGEAVLAGERNRVEVAGFDRWFGGTHIHHSDMWWLDGESIVHRP